MDPLETLRNEHSVALRVVHAAQRSLDEAAAGRGPNAERAREILDFFRYFINCCHTPKEEDLLFTALHRDGLAWDGPPLRELVRQHAELRAILDSASDRLRLVEEGVPGSLEPLLHDLRVALTLFETHVVLEEEVLFPLAEERLRARDVDELSAAFADIACDEQQEGVHEYYAGWATSLVGAGI